MSQKPKPINHLSALVKLQNTVRWSLPCFCTTAWFELKAFSLTFVISGNTDILYQQKKFMLKEYISFHGSIYVFRKSLESV